MSLLKNLFNKNKQSGEVETTHEGINNNQDNVENSDNPLDGKSNTVTKKSLDEKLRDFELYVENNQSQVFKYTVGGIVIFTLSFLILSIIPNNVKTEFSSYFVGNSNVKEEETKKTIEKAETRASLKLERISARYTEEQTTQYINYVNNYIDKYKGEQSLYTNVLEYISENCVTPVNENTKRFVKALAVKMNEHEKYFDKTNNGFKRLTEQCAPKVELYELPLSLKNLRNEYFKYRYAINHRHLEIEKLELKYGKGKVDPKTGDLLTEFVSDKIKQEQDERKYRFMMEDNMIKRLESSITAELALILTNDKKTGGQQGFLTLATIMRDYGHDFPFFYEQYGKRYGVENAKILKERIEKVIEHNKQLEASK